MFRRKSCYIIGFLMIWLSAGKPGWGRAQAPERLLPPPMIRLSSALLPQSRPRMDPSSGEGEEGFSPGWWARETETVPDSCFPLLHLRTVRGESGYEGCASFPTGDALCQPPRVLEDAATLLKKEAALLDSVPTSRTPRLLLFRMPTGFLAAPMGLDGDDDLFGAEDPAYKLAGNDDFPLVQVFVGKHIPYLDLYRRGDPGGLGYYRLHSQVQLYDSGNSSLCMGLQAYTPGSRGSCEVLNGPTILIPAISSFQEIQNGTALHAFIGAKAVTADGSWRQHLGSGFNCGLAVQQSVPLLCSNPEQGWFVFVQSLGKCRSDSLRGDVRATSWEFIPGMQWRMNSSCWMTMGISRFQFLTCSWQY